ncbi:WLM domain-containing protein [Mucidula mucida]|nr:WLM domain-containing protein [Mucidula mucida]
MSTDIWVKSFTHLKGRSKADEALSMLKKIASMVKPIMRSHKWVLPALAEFFPDQTNLLDVNMGQKILLRLRPHHTPDSFLEIEEVVQTMLHELTHNVHGPHDDKFYKFLSGLQDEYDKLVRSGMRGKGYFAQCPVHMARAKALEAAEKRRRMQALGDGGGRRLAAAFLELAAMAAERRARDEKMCGQGARAEEEAAKAAQESVIDLTGDSDSDDEVMVIDDPPIASGRAPGTTQKVSARKTDEWECSVLDACLTPRPVDSTFGWTCLTCGEGGMSPDFGPVRFVGR